MRKLLVIFSLFVPITCYAGDIQSCTPKILYFGDTFTINLNTPHGADFIIYPPSREKSFEICFWYPKDSKNKPETMFEYNECKNVKQVKLVAGITEVGGWNHEEESFGPFKSVLFQEVGTYEIIVSPNIETDDPVISKCLVEYKGKK